jgi:hypothetical protein
MSDLSSLSPRASRKGSPTATKSKWITLLVWFLVTAILAYVILYSWNPVYLQKKDVIGKPTGVSDPMMTIIASAIIGLIVALIVWFVQRK